MMQFTKLPGIPVADRFNPTPVIPFSMNKASYLSLNDLSGIFYGTEPVPEMLEKGDHVYRLNGDRTFHIVPRFDGFEDEGWNVFTFEGIHDDIYVIDVDHYHEKLFGYDMNKRQFFHVKMRLLAQDVSFTVGDSHYRLSKFLA